jgi:hypothetical protein
MVEGAGQSFTVRREADICGVVLKKLAYLLAGVEIPQPNMAIDSTRGREFGLVVVRHTYRQAPDILCGGVDARRMCVAYKNADVLNGL